MKRITFVAPPFAGHFNPLLVLACAARDAGYDVEFITGPRKHTILGENGIRAVALHSIGADTLEAIANTTDPVRGNPVKLLAQFRQNLQLLPAIRHELEQMWTAAPPALVVADSVAPVAGLVCEQLKIPWITTIATPFSIETRTATPSYCGGWTPHDNAFGRARDAAGRATVGFFKRIAARLFQHELAALGLNTLYREDGTEAIYSPHAILGFGLRELEFERDWPPPFEMIGPVITAPETISTAARAKGPRVLVTHGTHLLWAKKKLIDETVVLAHSFPGVEFAVSLGQPEHAADRPQQHAPRVTVHSFITYEDTYDAIIHHGGAGVTYAAILGGIPSVVVPRDYDQFDFAARIVHHQLGLRAQSIAHAAPLLARLLDRKQWPALDRFQQYGRAYSPKQRFLEAVDRQIR